MKKMPGNAARLLLAVLTVTASAAFAHGPWRADESNTSGWQLMSPRERLTYQAGIRRSRTHEECLRYLHEHQSAMRERAGRRGQALPPSTQGGCAGTPAKPARQR